MHGGLVKHKGTPTHKEALTHVKTAMQKNKKEQ
jgi:hypothetical protein